MKTYVLYNGKSNNGAGKASAEALKEVWTNKPLEFLDATEIGEYQAFFDGLAPEDEVCFCGGDGTLNYLINHADCDNIQNKIFYYPTGSGNDFWTDLGKKPGDAPEQINKYLVKLPTVTVNGKTAKFINGIGYGIDGYCCEEGDRLRTVSDKPINYTSIAIKGLLFAYKPTNAEIQVDDYKFSLHKVWLAPTMKGRFYGGGMMATPNQNRLDPERQVTCMVMNGAGKLHTLIDFPSIFKGEHVKKKIVKVMKGSYVKVKFDRAVALQIDGETVLGVTEYEVRI